MEDLSELSAAALLAAEQDGVRTRRQGEVDATLRLLSWCDRHSVDPQTQPGAVPAKYGGDKLVTIGGAGTPQVSELCFEEFAIAGSAGVVATTNKAADAFDLRHRLPNLFAAVRALEIDAWVARKVASLSRQLTLEQVEIVDLAVTAAVEESPSRILAIAEAKVIEADVEAHRQRIQADAARIGVWLQRKRAGQRVEEVDSAPDVQGIGMRLSGAGAVEFNTAVNDFADALAAQYTPADGEDGKTMDQFRAEAVELLSRPHEAAAFLDGLAEGEATHAPPAPKKRRAATLVVHLHHDVLSGQAAGVARAEGIGPLLLEQVAELLRHRSVTVQPVIDLNVGGSVNGYEHPTACKERTLLRATRDVFPHSPGSGTSRLDHDHATPYDPDGPPGQTGDHNDAPLNRRDHRAKTHLGYEVRQLGLNAYRWETPHGLTRVVTGRAPRSSNPCVAPTARSSASCTPASSFSGTTTPAVRSRQDRPMRLPEALVRPMIKSGKKPMNAMRAPEAMTVLDRPVRHTDFASLDGHVHVLLVTYKRDGTPIPSPVWFARDGETLYVWTEINAFKAKRVRNDPRALLAPCDARGVPEGDPIAARGRVLTDEADRQHAAKVIRSQWGIGRRLFELVSRPLTDVHYLAFEPAPRD